MCFSSIVQIYIPLIIAVLAIVFTIWQINIIKTHNKKSVIPQLNIQENCSADQDNFIGLYIINKGFGPAIIEKIIFYIDDKEFKMNYREDYIDISERLNLKLPIVSYGGFYNGDWISHNEQKFIFEISIQNLKANQSYLEQYFLHHITNLSIKISYKSIYGDKFILKEGNNFSKPFGQNIQNISEITGILKRNHVIR